MYRKKKNNYVVILLMVMLCLSLGYAFISTDLTITGISKFNSNSWNVYFDNIVVNPNSVDLSSGDQEPEIDATTNTDLSFTISLHDFEDFYEFTVDVVNGGSIDAMVGSITTMFNGAVVDEAHPMPNYLKFSVSYNNNARIAPYQFLGAGEMATYIVKLEFNKNVTADELPSTDRSISIGFSVNYVQADNNAIDRPSLFQFPQGRNKNNIQLGDEVCVNGATTECFYFIRYDGNDAVLLSKYNLKVGTDVSHNGSYHHRDFTISKIYTSSDPGYGLQDSTMRGHVDFSTVAKGVVAFSYDIYWDDNGQPKSKYPGQYSNPASSFPPNFFPYVYDTDYVTAPDFSQVCYGFVSNGWCTEGYSIAYYVEQYKNTLSGLDYGVNLKSARLLTFDEVSLISDCYASDTYSCITDSVYKTSFWIGSAQSEETAWLSSYDGTDWVDNDDYYGGVRPAIVVAKENL